MSQVEIFMWLVAAASLTATIANIHHFRFCFCIWFFCNVAWTIYDIHKEAYSQAVLMGIYAVLAVWGYWHWSKGKAPKKGRGAKWNSKRYKPCNKKFSSPLTNKNKTG